MLNDPTKITKPQRRQWEAGVRSLREIEYDIRDRFQRDPVVPHAWHTIWEDLPNRPEKSTRLTIRLDEDVVKFFRSYGQGYQPHINKVLRAYMHLRLARMIDGPDTTDYVERPEMVETQFERREL